MHLVNTECRPEGFRIILFKILLAESLSTLYVNQMNFNRKLRNKLERSTKNLGGHGPTRPLRIATAKWSRSFARPQLGNFTLNTRNNECWRFVLKRVDYITNERKMIRQCYSWSQRKVWSLRWINVIGYCLAPPFNLFCKPRRYRDNAISETGWKKWQNRKRVGGKSNCVIVLPFLF